jgi:hypothetical protein
MRTKAWRRSAEGFKERVKASPKLWLVPAGAVAAVHLIHFAMPRGLAAGFANSVLYALANAVFAEAWIASGARFDGDRFFEAAILFLSPLPLVAVLAFVTQLAIDRVIFGGNADAIMTAIRLQTYFLKAFGLGATIVAALSAPGLAAGAGAFDALPRGLRLFFRNMALALVLLAAGALLELGAGSAWAAWHASAYDAGAGQVEISRLLRIYLLTAATMFGAVAVPLHALETGLLEEP